MADREKFNKRIHELKKSLIETLSKKPKGIQKKHIWNFMARELNQVLRAKDFGVPKMHSLLEAYQDEITEVNIDGEAYIQLKKSQKSGNDNVQSDQISSTKRSKTRTVGSEKGDGRMSGFVPTSVAFSEDRTPSVGVGFGILPTPPIGTGMFFNSNLLPVATGIRPQLPVAAQYSEHIQQVMQQKPVDPWSHSEFKQENVDIVSSDDSSDESDEDFPRLDSPRQTGKSKGTSKLPSLDQLKQNLVEVLREFPGGVRKSEIWRCYAAKFHRQPAAKDYGVPRLTNILAKFTDVIEEFVRDSQPYVKLKLTKEPAMLPPLSVPWGGGAVMTNPHLSSYNRSLSSSTSSLDSQMNTGIGNAAIGWGGPNTSSQVRRPSGPGNKVIDLTDDDENPGESSQGKINLIDLTVEKHGMDFISLDIAPQSQRVPDRAMSYSQLQSQQFPGHSQERRDSHNLLQSMARPRNPDLSHQMDLPGVPGMSSIVDLTKPVKPVSTKTFEQKEIRVTPVRYHGRFPSKEQLENVAKDCIEILSEADEHVSLDRIEKLILQRFQMRNIRDLGVRYVDNISCVNEHNRMMSKVNAYIQAFVKVRSVCTLSELAECLKEFAPEKDNFTSLKLGPLQRLPLIYQMFKFPPDYVEIPDITTMDVLEHLRNFMTKYQKWTERLEMEEFMEYLVEEYDAENAYMLGVRLRSLPLCAQVLKKSQRDAGATRRAVTDGFKNEVRRDVEKVFHKFRAGILQTDSDGTMEVRRHYLQLNPILVINEIFQKFQLLMSIDPPSGKVQRKKHLKFQSAINEFMTLTRDDSFGRQLFQLAVCISNTVLEEAALEILVPSAVDEGQGQSQSQEQKAPPSREKVILDLKKYLERCIAHGSLTLPLIDKIEEKLLEDYEFLTFSAMGFGRFLHFLINEAKQILEECGGLNIGSGTGSQEGDSGYKPHQTDVLEFIHQCKQCGTSQPSQVETAICKQFSVKEVKNLGYGNLNRLMTAADRPGKHQTKDHSVIYETVLSSSLSSSAQSSMQIGILGHQTREAALACLHNCPLLEDLGSWSQWSLVFEPEHGKLKEFIQKYGGIRTSHIDGGKKLLTTDVIALEVQPGQLLKLTNQTSPDKFETALMRQDVSGACGHLMSLVLTNKGVENTPLALLANHMKTHLFSMHASDTADNVPGAPHSMGHTPDKAVKFVLDCLVKLPVRSVISLANQIFLDPLGQVVGSTKSKSLLFSTCRTIQEHNRLQELGCLLGISEWTKQIHVKCQLPVSAIEEVPVEEAEEFFADEAGMSEESDDESDSEASSISSILSDDDDENNALVEEKMAVQDKQKESHDKTTEKQDMEIDTGHQDSDSQKVGDENQAIKDNLKEKDTEKTDEGESEAEKDKNEAEKDDNEEEEELMTEEEKLHKQCVDIVNHIRRDEFGIGIELNEDGQRLMQVQQERLGRSLDRLSKDLYSKDTHFVLELVQNADDNSYPDEMLMDNSDCCPSVKFTMRNDAVFVLNNECGFKEKNIRALCDVGRSTKGKHKFGYIGQKGIGFKSVFRVTDKPEIHSNGFSICFDVNSGPMGYILPHWVDEDVWAVGEMWTTKIILPLKNEMQAAHTRSLAARFNDIHPSLLLFLHRLRQITIENQVESSMQTMRRIDYGKNLVEITHNDGKDQWLVIKKMLDASKISLQAKSGVDVESTEIALAFPLPPKGHRITTHVLPPKQPVFAFLPLRSYGFRFIIQGDFDVPSSREDVDKDSPWNQWIRNEIHTLFIEALEVFKNHQDFNSMEAVTSFLQFVPLEDEILDFFRPVSNQILQKLKAKPCVPTQPNSKGMMSWRIPSQTIIARDPLTREVVTPELLQKHLNLYYLHRDVAEALNSTLTQSLGIESLTTEHLLQIGKALMTEWIENEGTLDQLHMTAKWLACVYRSIDEFQDNEALFDKLKTMRIIPLATGKCVSVSESTIFFPLVSEETDQNKPAFRFVGRDPVSVLHQDLNTIHPGLIDTSDNEVNSQVQKLLLKLGVKQLSPHDVVNHHILPILKSDTWQDKGRDTLVSYVVYLKEQSEQQNVSINMEELQRIVRVNTNKGVKNPKEEAVHFTPLYGNKIDLSLMFPGYDWILLDGVYLQQSNNQIERKRWHDFFSKLGITNFLAVRPQKVEISSENISETPWAPLSQIWGPIPSGCYITDHSCKEFHDLIKCNTYQATYQEQMTRLFEVLDREWDKTFSSFTMSNMCDGEGRSLREVESSFSIHLKTLSWLPAKQTEVTRETNGSVSWTETLTLMQPSCLYRHSPEVKSHLSHTVLYLEANVSQSSSFCEFLGIKNSVSIEEVKKSLIKWSKRDKEDIPAIFCTSPTHIETIYKYLYDNLPPKQLQELLHDNPVIFVPMVTNGVNYSSLSDSPYGRPPAVIAGKMLSRNEVWWEDKTELIDKYREILDEYHADIGKKHTLVQLYSRKEETRKMLLDGGRIEKEPSITEYGELLILMGSILQLSDKSVLSDTLKLYATIGNKLSIPEGVHDEQTAKMILETKKKELMSLIKKKKIIVTKQKEWVGIEDHPMIADVRELEKIFEVKEGVHFVKVDDDSRGQDRKIRLKKKETGQFDMDHVNTFLELCGVKKLSECVKTELVTEMFELIPKLRYYMHQVVPLIQRFLYTNYTDVYQQNVEFNMAAFLQDVQFVQVSKLDCKYSLMNRPDIYVIQSEKCSLTDSEAVFYFHKDYVTSYPDINREIAKFFSFKDEKCSRELRSFLHEVSNELANPQGDVWGVLDSHDVDPYLPDEELVWMVPPPPPEQMAPEPVVEEEPEPEPEAAPAEPPSGEEGKSTSSSSGGMKAWPPMSDDRMDGAPKKNDKKEEKSSGSKVWPPPKAPDYFKSVRELPSQVKVTNETSGEDDGKQRQDGVEFVGSGIGTVGGLSGQQREGCTPHSGSGANIEDGGIYGRQISTDDSRNDGNKRKMVDGNENIEQNEQKRSRTPTEGEEMTGTYHGERSHGISGSRQLDAENSDQGHQGWTKNSSEFPVGSGHGMHSRGDNQYQDDQGRGNVEYDEDGQPINRQRGDEYHPRLGGSSKRRREESESDSPPPVTPKKSAVHLDNPIWNEISSEYTYEELGKGHSLKVPPENVTLDTASETERTDNIGRWGERLVYNFLLQEKENWDHIIDIIWRNEEMEMGFPYDFEVHMSTEEGITVTYIEVKSTISDNKEVFEISYPQIQFAKEQKEYFHIYRVFNAGDSENVRLVRIDNLSMRLDQKQVRLCMLI